MATRGRSWASSNGLAHDSNRLRDEPEPLYVHLTNGGGAFVDTREWPGGSVGSGLEDQECVWRKGSTRSGFKDTKSAWLSGGGFGGQGDQGGVSQFGSAPGGSQDPGRVWFGGSVVCGFGNPQGVWLTGGGLGSQENNGRVSLFGGAPDGSKDQWRGWQGESNAGCEGQWSLPFEGPPGLETTKNAVITTVMIRNLPRRTSHSGLVAELDQSGYGGQYDFVHVPEACGAGRKNKSYAFVNFRTPAVAAKFMQEWHKTQRMGMQGKSMLTVSAALVQGLADNIAFWEGVDGDSSVPKRKHARPVIFLAGGLDAATASSSAAGLAPQLSLHELLNIEMDGCSQPGFGKQQEAFDSDAATAPPDARSAVPTNRSYPVPSAQRHEEIVAPVAASMPVPNFKHAAAGVQGR